MLATHLSFPEIAAELFLSPHTIKSQAVSLYRKLGASSQGQGVAGAGSRECRRDDDRPLPPSGG